MCKDRTFAKFNFKDDSFDYNGKAFLDRLDSMVKEGYTTEQKYILDIWIIF